MIPLSGHSSKAVPAHFPRVAIARSDLRNGTISTWLHSTRSFEFSLNSPEAEILPVSPSRKLRVREKEHVALSPRTKAHHVQAPGLWKCQRTARRRRSPSRRRQDEICKAEFLQGGHFKPRGLAEMKASPRDVQLADFETGRKPRGDPITRSAAGTLRTAFGALDPGRKVAVQAHDLDLGQLSKPREKSPASLHRRAPDRRANFSIMDPARPVASSESTNIEEPVHRNGP